MNDSERLTAIINENGMSAKKFSEHIGAKSPQVLYDVLKGRNGISKELAAMIHAKCVNYSYAWILTGKDGEANQTNQLSDSITYTYSDTMNEYVNTAYKVPFLPLSAYGGTLQQFVEAAKDPNSDFESIISPIKGVDFALPVASDSMSPDFPSGSQVLIKRINEKAFIEWNKVYVLDTCNGTLLKKLMPGSNSNKIKCVSINPNFPDFEVDKADINGFYRVLLCMTIK